jgi:hypothetical protein
VNGELTVNDTEIAMRDLVQFEFEDGETQIKAEEHCYILFGHSDPFNKPLVSQGPFVINIEEEIKEAYQDFRSGRMDTWN